MSQENKRILEDSAFSILSDEQLFKIKGGDCYLHAHHGSNDRLREEE